MVPKTVEMVVGWSQEEPSTISIPYFMGTIMTEDLNWEQNIISIKRKPSKFNLPKSMMVCFDYAIRLLHLPSPSSTLLPCSAVKVRKDCDYLEELISSSRLWSINSKTFHQRNSCMWRPTWQYTQFESQRDRGLMQIHRITQQKSNVARLNSANQRLIINSCPTTLNPIRHSVLWVTLTYCAHLIPKM